MQKKMNFLALVLLLLVSCKKNQQKPITPEVSNGTISADLNSVHYNFNTGTNANMEVSNGQYNLYISGKTVGDSTLIIFNLSSPSPIVSGNSATPGLFQYYAPPGTGFLHIYENNEGATTPVNITITSITASTVEGTFNGVLIDATGHLLTVTNGEFNINNIANTN